MNPVTCLPAVLRALAFLCLAMLPAATCAAQVRVFAAASLKESLDAVSRQFEAAGGARVSVVYGASSALARQIEHGAPADVFLSADGDWVDWLEARGLAVPGSRVNLLGNALVLIAPAAKPVQLRIAPGFALAKTLGDGKLSIANPDAVPAGKYAKAALQKLGVWESVQQHIVGAENVRVALAYVSRGEAPLGIVYRTDALADSAVRIVDTFPADTHPPITYPAVLVAGGRAAQAQALLNFLARPATRATWQQFGFTPLR